MKVVILPGYSKYNKQWMLEVKNFLTEKKVKDVVGHGWEHWKTGGGFQTKSELEKVFKEVGDGKVCIVAKSVGTRLSMRLVKDMPHRIHKLILCGIPTTGESESAKNAYSPLSEFDAKKVVVIQNSKDPLGNYKKVDEFIKTLNKDIKVVEKQRNDHHYPYYGEIYKFLNYGQ
jgi:predicted alpha/beta hydrolase family esterase